MRALVEEYGLIIVVVAVFAILIAFSSGSLSDDIKTNVSDGIDTMLVTEEKEEEKTEVTSELKTGTEFKKLIPSTATAVIFTDETAPSGATTTDVTANGDGSAVAWLDDTTWYVSSQDKSTKILFNSDSSKMFESNSKIKTIKFGKNNIDTSKVTSTAYMFANADVTSVDIQNFDTSNVVNMRFMFQWCGKLESLNVSKFSTNNVTNMDSLFYGCSKLTELDVSNFNTEKVTNMSGLFGMCSSLKTIDVRGFNTSNVTSMSIMFEGCYSLVSIDVSNFDTSNVRSMNGMFYNCKSLTSLDLSNFNTSNVISFGTYWNADGMFGNCYMLESLDLSNFVADKVTSAYGMFSGCRELEYLNLSNFKLNIQLTDSEYTASYFFRNCTSLCTIVAPSFSFSDSNRSSNLFDGCACLMAIYNSSETGKDKAVSVDEGGYFTNP